MSSQPTTAAPEGARKTSFFTIVVAAFLIASGCAAVVFASGVGNQGSSTAPPPLSILSFVSSGGLPAFMNLTMHSSATVPIINVTAQVLVGCGECAFVWVSMYLRSPPNITLASPLLPGQPVSFVIVTGGNSALRFGCNESYSFTISGFLYPTSSYPNPGPPFALISSQVLTCP